jgi:hypothetical protein
MKAVITKISACFLLIAASIPFALILFLHVKQQAIRHKMKESLEQQLLQTINLSEEEVQWIKPGKEILVDGKMFDVKSFYPEHGQYKFTGLFDQEETALVKQLENNCKKNNEPGSQLLTNLFQWLQSVYPNDIAEPLLVNQLTNINFCFINIHLISPCKTILTPPPQA